MGVLAENGAVNRSFWLQRSVPTCDDPAGHTDTTKQKDGSSHFRPHAKSV